MSWHLKSADTTNEYLPCGGYALPPSTGVHVTSHTKPLGLMYMYTYKCTCISIKGIRTWDNVHNYVHVHVCYRNYLFFRCKIIFVRRKYTKIFYTKIMLQRKFFPRIFRTSTYIPHTGSRCSTCENKSRTNASCVCIRGSL